MVPFPCKVELQRMIAIKKIRTDKDEGVMAFEEWDQKIEPVEYLQKVWVNMYGVPFQIRSSYLCGQLASFLGPPKRLIWCPLETLEWCVFWLR